jgi:hypothetical protein
MNIENEEFKKPDAPRSPGVTDRDAIAPEQPEQEVKVVRRPIVPDVTDTPAQPDDPRSPGVTDRIAPKKPDQEVEVVRRLVAPDVTDVSAKSDDPRSPGVTDRDISIEEITANTTEETETVRKLIVPDEVESEDSSSLTNE